MKLNGSNDEWIVLEDGDKIPMSSLVTMARRTVGESHEARKRCKKMGLEPTVSDEDWGKQYRLADEVVRKYGSRFPPK